MTIRFRVNETEVQVDEEDADQPLVFYLQDDLNLTGTKFGCGIGVCRACTVAVQRNPSAPWEPLLSCSTPVSKVGGYTVRTVEALGSAESLHPLQTAFLDCFAFQCGYCTPGFLMASWVLIERLRRSPVSAADLDEVIEQSLGAHICRCTGYVRYYEAVQATLRKERLVR